MSTRNDCFDFTDIKRPSFNLTIFWQIYQSSKFIKSFGLSVEILKFNSFISFVGVFRGGIEVLVRAKLALSDGVNMQLTVRSQDPDVSELITATIG